MRSIAGKTIKYVGIFFITLYCLIWLLTPSISRYFINDFLTEQQLALTSESSIRYNPFLSKLTISDLTLTDLKPNVASFKLNELVLQLSLYKLLSDKISIAEFQLTGLYLAIEKQDEQLKVAGYNLNQPVANDETTAPVSTEPATPFPYQVVMPRFTLNNSVIEINLDGSKHRIVVDNLTLSELLATIENQSLSFNLAAKIDDAPLTVASNIAMTSGSGKIDLTTVLNQLNLANYSAFIPAPITALTGVVDISNQQVIEITEDNISVAMSELTLKTSSLHIEQPDIKLTLAEQTLTTNQLAILLVNNQAPIVNGKAAFALNGLAVTTDGAQNHLLTLDNAKLVDIEITTVDELMAVGLGSLALSNLILSDNTADDIPALVNIEQFDVSQIQASEKGISIDQVNLGKFNVTAILDKNKALANLIPIAPAKESQETISTEQANAATSEVSESETANTTPETEQTENTDATKPSFSIRLAQFNLVAPSEISFTDNSVSPVFAHVFTINTLSAGPIDNQQPETKSHFNLIGKSEEYANFNLSGFATPFHPKPTYHVAGFFKEFSLPDVSTYVKDAMQYEFHSGQLDLTVDVTLDGAEIEGKTGILLRGMELTAAADHESGSLKDQTSVPFNVALGMLKDGDGNVKLDIPLSGDTSAPSFGLSGFVALIVKQATMSAAKDYLMATFVPYANVVSIAMSAGEYMLKLRFNDLPFEPTQTELSAEHSEFLSQFAALMREKSETQVTLCALATAQDIGKAAGEKITDANEVEQLKQLSLSRLKAFKNHMINVEKLESSRMLLCNPQIDSASDALPRITFAT